MKHRIDKILDLVSSAITSYKEGPPLSTSYLPAISAELINEIVLARSELLRAIFHLLRPVQVEALVQNYQAVIIRLIDEVYATKNTISPESDLLKEFSSITDALNGFLTFIETYFVRYFNQDQKVPELYYSIISNDFRHQCKAIRMMLVERGASPALTEIILSKFEKTEADKKTEARTYKTVIYLKELLNEIVLVVNDIDSDDVNARIESLLIAFNFNDPSFINYVLKKIASLVTEEQSMQEKILILRYQQKEFSTINCRTTVVFYEDLMTAKEQIMAWLEEEIKYLLNQTVILSQRPIEEKPDVNYKISTSLSVPQLAFLVRLLVEDKVIINQNQTEILKFFCTNFTTLKRENISYAHLRGQYYKAELPAIEAVKNLLVRLLNLSRRLK